MNRSDGAVTMAYVAELPMVSRPDVSLSGVSLTDASLPDAPLPQVASSADWSDSELPDAELDQQTGAQAAYGPQKSEREKAEEQIHEEEHQRVLGILPAFNSSYRNDAVALTRKQKMSLAFHTAVDPMTFGVAMVIGGYHDAKGDYWSYGGGMQGYGKRVGAAYLDAFDGTMLGNGILPSLLHQDPRYFRLGHGSVPHRILYAASTSFICKGDKSRKWEPNISNVGGNILSGEISNLYYPSADGGAGHAIADGMVTTVTGMVGGLLQEFWPDISRKFLHKDPTHGLDDEWKSAHSPVKQ